jgi:hypothetical protein
MVVPDLELIVREYLAADTPLAALSFLFRPGLNHSWQDFLHPGSHHCQMFEARALLHMVRGAGFEHVEVSRYRKSGIAEIHEIELEERQQESLCVEAQK